MNSSPLIIVTKSRQYKYVVFLAMFYVLLGLITPFFTEKKVITGFGSFPVPFFVSQFWFIANDVVAEVYGFKIAKNFFYSYLICFLIISTVCNALFSIFLITTLLKIAALLLAWRVNTKLLLIGKFFTRGRYFWLRSLGSSSIGETLFILMLIPVWMFLHLETSPFWIRTCLEFCVFRIVMTAIFITPCIYLAAFLKKAENLTNVQPNQYFPILDLKKLQNA